MMNNNTFYTLLEKIRNDLLNNDLEVLKNISDIDFEVLFAERLTYELKAHESDILVDYHEGSTKFPDIGCTPYGVEIKTTSSNKWISLGNSIMEGTKRLGCEEIFVVFLKKGGNLDIRIKTLDESISDIKITHSPRYEINMDQKSDSILDEMHTDYQTFSKSSDKIRQLKKYYQNRGSKSWWLDDEKESSVSMEICSFSALSKEEKNGYIVELFVLFPQMLKSDYEDAALYMITKHNIFDKSFRDKISAGGMENFKLGTQSYKVSKSVANLYNRLLLIEAYILESKNFSLITNTAYEECKSSQECLQLWYQRADDFIKTKKNRIDAPLEEIARRLKSYSSSKRLTPSLFS